VVQLLEQGDGAAKLMMGGTDLIPGLRDGVFRPRVVVDVKGLPGMRDLVFDAEGGLTVGAAVTMNDLAGNADVRAHYALLSEAAETVASYQLRNRATLGGNLCTASPCADTSPATLVLEAEFVLYGPDGERTVPAGEFFLGPGQTVLQPREFMTSIRLPSPPRGLQAHYLKLGRCKSGDLSLVGVAACAYLAGTPGGYEFRLGLGSVAPTAVRAADAEAFLAANRPGEEAFSRAAEMAMAAASPITDVRGSADYQRAMVRTLTLRGLRAVWAQLQGRN
jgi:carbon-monoxide dehydrogenase medium subunit